MRINKKGITAVCAIAIIAITASCNRDTDLIAVCIGDNWGYANHKGEIVINPQYEYAYSFSDGLALVQIHGEKQPEENQEEPIDDDDRTIKVSYVDEPFSIWHKPDENVVYENYGYIDARGNWAIPPTYCSATSFSEGIAWVVSRHGAPTAIDTKGKTLFVLDKAIDVTSFSEGFAAVSELERGKKLWGIVYPNGKFLKSPQFERVGQFNKGLCPVETTERKIGFINKKGEFEIPPQFSAIGEWKHSFESGYEAVQNHDGKWGIIDKKGMLVVSYQYEERIQMTPYGKACVCLCGKWGVIDMNGNYIINSQYDEILPDGEMFKIKVEEKNGSELFGVVIEEKYGWCDEKGKLVIEPKYGQYNWFGDNDIAFVNTFYGSCCGIIDKNGNNIIDWTDLESNHGTEYRSGDVINKNLIFVNDFEKYGIMNSRGEILVAPVFDDYEVDEYETEITTDKRIDFESILRRMDFKELRPDKYSFAGINAKYGISNPEIKYERDCTSQQLEQGSIDKVCYYRVNVHGYPAKTDWDKRNSKMRIFSYVYDISARDYEYEKKMVNTINELIPKDYRFNRMMKHYGTTTKWYVSASLFGDNVIMIEKYRGRIKIIHRSVGEDANSWIEGIIEREY